MLLAIERAPSFPVSEDATVRGLLQQVLVLVVAAGLACACGDAAAQGLLKTNGLPKSFSLPVADAEVPAH